VLDAMQERFIRERTYLKGVTPNTVLWYRDSFRAFAGATDTKDAIQERIVALRERGISPISINTYLRAVNAYNAWRHAEGHAPDVIRIPRLKEPQKVLATLRPEHIAKILGHRPTDATRRAHTLVVLLLDTGLRFQEALNLRWSHIDLDNLLVTVELGKGQRGRVVPMSSECRKVMFKWQHGHVAPDALVFPSRSGRVLDKRNVLDEFHALGKLLGIEGVRFSPHTMRHTLGLNYLRNGGDPFRLQKLLGHRTLELTRRYCAIQTSDLSAVHERFSVIGGGR
jgi:integrase/recombinase XerD